MHPIRVPHTDSGGHVCAVRRAVDDRLLHLGVVEDGGHIVDDLVDGQRLGRQVGTAIVVAGHPDPAVLDHDHVEALGGRVPTKPPVERDRRGARAAGDDDQRMCRLAARYARSTGRTPVAA